MLIFIHINGSNILYSDFVIKDVYNNKIITLLDVISQDIVYVKNKNQKKILKNIIYIKYGNIKKPNIEVLENQIKIKNKKYTNIPIIDYNKISKTLNIQSQQNKLSLQSEKDLNLNKSTVNILTDNDFEITKEIYSLGLSITNLSYWEKNKLKRLYINTNLGDIYININKGTFHLDTRSETPKYFDMNSAKKYIMYKLELKNINDIKSINQDIVNKMKKKI